MLGTTTYICYKHTRNIDDNASSIPPIRVGWDKTYKSIVTAHALRAAVCYRCWQHLKNPPSGWWRKQRYESRRWRKHLIWTNAEASGACRWKVGATQNACSTTGCSPTEEAEGLCPGSAPRAHDSGWMKWTILIAQDLVSHCCNLSGGVALNAGFTTNGMCVKNNTRYKWREQAIIEWLRRGISIVACCHSVKLCAHTARDFRSQQNTRSTGKRMLFIINAKLLRERKDFFTYKLFTKLQRGLKALHCQTLNTGGMVCIICPSRSSSWFI